MGNMKKSVLNEEYTEKIKEMAMCARKAYDIFESLPDNIKVADRCDIRFHLASASNSINLFAWGFQIDTKTGVIEE